MADSVQTATIETRVPSRLDRLPWSRFHWRVLIGLGTVWLLDGLEVTMVSSVAARLTDPRTALALTAGQVGLAAAIYIVGACTGALFFGHLTDRFGRKKLFLITLLVYITATVATAFSFAPWYFYLTRFFTGAGIGGEYAAIHSAIDELIPSRVRGRVDLIISGTYWLGAAAGAGMAILFLQTWLFPVDLGWRLAFGVGALLGLVILVVRRNVPESPRWLFIHGREDEAERIVDDIERTVVEDTGEPLEQPDRSITVRQRETVSFRTIASTAFKLYPKRSVLGVALFVGQAFIYNGVTFSLGLLFTEFYGIDGSIVPVFIVAFALFNFLGPVTLGRLFDTVGRKQMITATYIGSAVMTVPLAVLFVTDNTGGALGLMGLIGVTFFLASAGASAAYLTVSEIFPMETRALAIAFFYAIGTSIGGITGPLLFGQFIGSGDRSLVIIAFLIGGGAMLVGGIAEIFFGVRSEKAALEDIAKPLSVADAEEGDGAGDEEQESGGTGREDGHRQDALGRRAEAERCRAEAAEHRARAALVPAGEGDGGDPDTEQAMAELAELRAQGMDEQAAALDELAAAQDADDEHRAAAARERAAAAAQRAFVLAERERALTASDDAEERSRLARAEAAAERSRAAEQRGLAEEARASAGDGQGGTPADVARARAAVHHAWADVHDTRAGAHEARADGDSERAGRAEHDASSAEARARAAEQRVGVAEHTAAAEDLSGEQESARDRARRTAAGRDPERERRVAQRMTRRRERDRAGLRRVRPGPSPRAGGVWLSEPDVALAGADEEALDREVDVIGRALGEHGAVTRAELVRLVGARFWGPGRFGAALGTALDEGLARRVGRRTYAPAGERDAS